MWQTKNSLLYKVAEIFCILVLLSHWLVVISNYSVLPETIPIHFDASGKADGFGSKNSIFFTPILSLLLYIVLSSIQKNPKNFNYPVAITPENIEIQYNNSKKLLQTLKLIIAATFLFIDYKTIEIAKTKTSEGLGFWFMPIFLVLIFTPILFSIYQSIKNK